MNRQKYLQNIKADKTYWFCESCGKSILFSGGLCPCHKSQLSQYGAFIGVTDFGAEGIDLNAGEVGHLWGADFHVTEQVQAESRTDRYINRLTENARREQLLAQALSSDRALNRLAQAMAGPVRRNMDYR